MRSLLGWLLGETERRPLDHALGQYTDAERAHLLARGTDACHVPEHARAMELHGYWKHQAGEYKKQLDAALNECDRLRALLAHPASGQEAA